MTKTFAAERFRLNLVDWAQELTDPNAGAGSPAAIGSFWDQAGPSVPTELSLKLRAADDGWVRLDSTYNVKSFGAKGDGVTDDTAAIQAATDACNAAGGGIVYFPPVDVAAGKFYRLTKNSIFPPLTYYASIQLDNYHNITFLGDGYASRIVGDDDVVDLSRWNLFQIQNGSSHIRFENLSLSLALVLNAGTGSGAVYIVGNALDANTGMSDFAVSGCYGDSKHHIITFEGIDDAHRVVRCTLEDNAFSTTSTTSGLFGSAYFDQLYIVRNYANCPLPVNLTQQATTLPADIRTWVVQDNHFIRTDGGGGSMISIGLGRTEHNTLVANSSTAVITSNAPCTHRLTHRGNVVLQLDANASSVIAGVAMAAGGEVAMIGNVAVCTNLTGAATGVMSTPGAVLAGPASCVMNDNVLETSNTTTAVALVSMTSIGTVSVNVSGNLAICRAVTAGLGIGINLTGINNAPGTSMVGNLVLAVGAAADLFNFGLNISNAVAASHLMMINFNMTGGIRRLVFVGTTAATAFEWRGVNDNFMGRTAGELSAITMPSGNIGITQEGNAAPSPQMPLAGVTPVGNVTAPVGSLAGNTAGVQSATLFYKESGTGLSGGTTGWFGIGAFEQVAGTLLGSVATAARFFAPGGMGLAVESTVEIKWVVPRAGTMRNLRVRCTAGTGGATNTYTVRKNGVNTTLTVGILNTATNGSDTTHSFTVVAGDLISVQVTKSAVPTTPQARISTSFEIVS